MVDAAPHAIPECTNMPASSPVGETPAVAGAPADMPATKMRRYAARALNSLVKLRPMTIVFHRRRPPGVRQTQFCAAQRFPPAWRGSST